MPSLIHTFLQLYTINKSVAALDNGIFFMGNLIYS